MDAFSTKIENADELQNHKGKKLGISPWFKVTQERINQFAEATNDHQWIHIDRIRSEKESPYKVTIAHGFLILSLIPYLAKQAYKIDNITMGINYGTDKVRFMNAVKSDSNVRVHVELIDTEPIDQGIKFFTRNTVEIQGEDKPACVADLIAIVR